MPKEDELRKLSNEELIKKYNQIFRNLCKVQNSYRNLKADIIIIKKQLSHMSESIVLANNNNRENGTIKYKNKGGC